MTHLARPRLRRLPVLLALSAGLLLATASQALAVLQSVPDANTLQTDGRVEAILRVGPVVYVGGSFANVLTPAPGNAPTPRANLFAMDAHTGALLPWDPSPNGKVRALAASPGGRTILIGGDFTAIHSLSTPIARAHLASVSACAAVGATVGTCTGTVQGWHPNPDGNVFALATMGGRVYVGGNFRHVGGGVHKNLAAVGLTSGRALAWGAGASDTVHALAVSPTGTRVFAGGNFTKIGTAAIPHLAALSPTTGRPQAWRGHPDYVVLSLAATSQRLYLGGGGGGGHVASYRMSDGRKYWQPATDGDVTGVAPYHGWLFVTGHFTTVNGVPGHVHLALMNATTSKVNAGWTPGANSLLGTFPAVAYGQQVYTGGDFTKIGATPRQSHAHFAAFSDTVTDSTSPTITRPPSVAMRAGTTIGSAVPVTLSWGGTDDVSGICRFTIRQAIDSGAYGLLTPVLPRFTSLPRALRFNATYRFHVTATDCSDNVSTVSGGTARVGVYQNGSPSITYSGSWKRASVSGASGGGISYTTRRGSGAALNFTGRQVAWVASKSAGRGRANVYVDGQLIKVVDLHAGSLVRRQVVFTRTFPTAGAHRIKVIAQGTPGRPMVDVDAFLVLR